MALEGELPAAVRAVRAEPRQSRGDLFLQLGIDKGDAVGILQDELLDSRIGHQGHPVARDCKAVSPARGFFDDAQQAPAHWLCAGHPDLGALQRVEESGRRVER